MSFRDQAMETTETKVAMATKVIMEARVVMDHRHRKVAAWVKTKACKAAMAARARAVVDTEHHKAETAIMAKAITDSLRAVIIMAAKAAWKATECVHRIALMICMEAEEACKVDTRTVKVTYKEDTV
jgi:hypothetical protein